MDSTEGMRTCIGSEKFGLPRHEAPIGDFPKQPSQKDGLGRMCKEHWTAYTRALRTASTPRPAAGGTPNDELQGADSPPPPRAKAKPGRKSGTARTAARKPKQSAAEEAMRVPIVHSGESDPPVKTSVGAESSALFNAAQAEGRVGKVEA